jgi:K+-transporting ATPase ATPase A chain
MLMTLLGWLQIGLLFGAVLLVVKPLGIYMAQVFEGQRSFLSPISRGRLQEEHLILLTDGRIAG